MSFRTKKQDNKRQANIISYLKKNKHIHYLKNMKSLINLWNLKKMGKKESEKKNEVFRKM